MSNIIRGSTREVLDIRALTVKVGKKYDFLLVELAQLFRNYHIVMSGYIIKFDDEVIPAEIVRYLPIQRSTCESSPEYLLTLAHRLIRLRYSSVEVDDATDLGVGF